MSDNGSETPVVADVEEVQVQETEAPKGKMSVEDALKEVLKKALVHDGLARGLRECAKALDKRQAHLCVLNESCTEGEYVKLIEALCAEHKINLIKISDPKLLGEWAGLCKLDKDGIPRKVVGCSCVVVKDYGQESEALSVLLEYFQSRWLPNFPSLPSSTIPTSILAPPTPLSSAPLPLSPTGIRCRLLFDEKT
ncbi:40S ribosomal protein s12 [Rhodotorula toruloides]|uniref:40S ribosomal protein S12 n=2 Tax=Rhodotorula toruloides TaxID=5286 RepID=A0A511KGH5_RHOTO|nr:40S ribosomal protein s12 [Rhodotorula toruloides]